MDFVDIQHGTWLFYAYLFLKELAWILVRSRSVGEGHKWEENDWLKSDFFPVLVDVAGTWSSLWLVYLQRVSAYK